MTGGTVLSGTRAVIWAVIALAEARRAFFSAWERGMKVS
jgi:hypothetical protein